MLRLHRLACYTCSVGSCYRPLDKCFACIDLCRLAALHPHFAEMLDDGSSAGQGNKLVKLIASKCAEGRDLVRIAERLFCAVKPTVCLECLLT